mmetsp:Transcript_25372/g.55128  ORF Transcript_25372/g.55128 Transcript_25372/m.55128 type:complete len:478 (+) Transcript_25372:84-1517(+)
MKGRLGHVLAALAALIVIQVDARYTVMVPGPVEFTHDVLRAAGGPSMSHMDPNFINHFGETLELLREIFLTKVGQPFVVAGSGTLGWDMFAAAYLEPGDSVLVLNTGYFGDRFAENMEVYGANITHLRAPVGDRPSLQEIEQALASAPHPYKAITITHVDTSTGVLMDVKETSALVRKKSPSTLIVVDGVCSVGGEELYFDEWRLDVVITASQKALGVPPGLAIMMFSPWAIAALEARTSPIPAYYGSLKKWLPIMRAYEAREPKYFATPPVQLIMALRASLHQILQSHGHGHIRERFYDHRDASNTIKSELMKWGLKFVPTTLEAAAHTMTAVYLPEGINPKDVLEQCMNRHVLIAGGLHPELVGRYIRIGHMHVSITDKQMGHVKRVLFALKEALHDLGYDTEGPEAEWKMEHGEEPPHQEYDPYEDSEDIETITIRNEWRDATPPSQGGSPSQGGPQGSAGGSDDDEDEYKDEF